MDLQRWRWSLYGVAAIAPLPGFILFHRESGNSLLGMYLLTVAVALLATAAVVAFMQRRKVDLIIGILLLLYMIPFALLAFYTCWLASSEGKCPAVG